MSYTKSRSLACKQLGSCLQHLLTLGKKLTQILLILFCCQNQCPRPSSIFGLLLVTDPLGNLHHMLIKLAVEAICVNCGLLALQMELGKTPFSCPFLPWEWWRSFLPQISSDGNSWIILVMMLFSWYTCFKDSFFFQDYKTFFLSHRNAQFLQDFMTMLQEFFLQHFC